MRRYEHNAMQIGKLNKRRIGHIAHPRNQFKSMNTLKQSCDNKYYKIDPVDQEEEIFTLS